MDLEYDPETKLQSREWHTAKSSRSMIARMSKSKINSMSTSFFDSQWIVHNEFVLPGQTVNQTIYREVLERLRKRVIVYDQALRALGCCTTRTLLVTR